MSEPIDLGHGHVAHFFAWSPDRELNPRYAHLPDLDPAGLIIGHPPFDMRWIDDPDVTCSGTVNFESTPAHREAWGGSRPEWQVISLDPLTLSPSILCRRCGDHGFIREGRWIPA